MEKVLLLTYAESAERPVKTRGLYDKMVAEIKTAGLELHELADVAPNSTEYMFQTLTEDDIVEIFKMCL